MVVTPVARFEIKVPALRTIAESEKVGMLLAAVALQRQAEASDTLAWSLVA
jgi:hypothetical protein